MHVARSAFYFIGNGTFTNECNKVFPMKQKNLYSRRMKGSFTVQIFYILVIILLRTKYALPLFATLSDF